MSERSIRRHITLSPAENEIINNFIKKQGVSFSEFLRFSALKNIKESENLSLKEYLDRYCEKVDEEEQKELDELMKNINLEEDEGSEITLEDFLQNNI
ncbi:hypothetical protein CJ209_11975 [Fusobacterium nucleatum]|uniref:CopG family transcriptional regulator n=2 Tax=Fusobacterium TaxID=848 RepID=H1HGL6_9FUSO|nr:MULTISPECIES: hypothetical protein [Fusobacterium]EEW94697.1 hypothetical protein HMPREF0406_01497 [Fusobacterium animalis 3_1_33]EHO76691.1 hypothetical protein HMPREF9942_01617 [Fusobacterium animalis F0419]MCG6845097.1 hypothetical protein [Fusobacterium nucleatum]OFQ55518.1 hypothetical protein HMPREF2931_00160 [Fusobacterium sp. HMSC065F01]PMC67676.1 hypothetical protein CJ209_11975 [Fusobacterium nucleatum]